MTHGLDVGVGTFNVEKGKKQSDKQSGKIILKKSWSVKHGGKFIMVQSSSNMEKKRWQAGQKISGSV